MLFTDDGWVGTRIPGRVDLYVFGYGLDHAAALEALAALSGRPPVLPRWVLGNWWSRYHAYSDTDYLALMDRFAAEDLPFSVAVIDMDWHRVADVEPLYGSGWTGYSWNRSLFPDPPEFLAELHRRGLRVTLNVHPADGVRAFEDAYPAMCEALGVDPASAGTDPVRPDRPALPRRVLLRPAAAGSRTTASTSGGSTGSPGGTRGSTASIRSGCSTTSTSSTPRTTADGR